jgi:hypothetical protein
VGRSLAASADIGRALRGYTGKAFVALARVFKIGHGMADSDWLALRFQFEEDR